MYAPPAFQNEGVCCILLLSEMPKGKFWLIGNSIMDRLGYLLAAGLFLLSGCGGGPTGAPTPTPVTYSFSFETDWEGWAVQSTDLELGGGLINWSVTRSQDQAFDGNTSVKFYLENFNDAGKVWIERPFSVAPNAKYQVTLDYAFYPGCSPDEIVPLTIITGVFQSPPQTGSEIQSAAQRPCHQGDPSVMNPQWVTKTFQFTSTSAESARLYVVIGIWGTWETAMTTWVDSVHITLTEM